jgi:flagellar motor switch protein FliG
MDTDRTHLRKAAVLIASLDQPTADALLEQLEPGQAEVVRRMVAALDEIDPAEQEAVIGQFLGKELAAKPQAAARSGPPFRFLHEARCEQLLPFLEHEHPQTVAVVISHLPPDRAAQLIYALPPALQADVLRRLVDLEETDPEILREVEQGLEERIARHVQSQRRRVAGLSALVNILEAADPRLQQTLRNNLTHHAPQLAQLLPERSSLGTFDDLDRFDDATLARLLEAAGAQTTTLALAGAREPLVGRVLSLLPAEEAESLKLAWSQMGPTPLSDLEDAQEELLELARQVE